MPGFFRGARVSAVFESRFVKYVAYGLGEILLVFIGITLAIAFENSAEARRQAELTRGLLVGIQQNLGANIAELEDNIVRDRQFLASVEAVLGHLATSSDWSDSVSADLENALYWTSPFLAMSGYGSLQQAGLHMVSDTELRTAIVHLHETTYGFLVGDHDRSMWDYTSSVMNPLVSRELVRVDDGRPGGGILRPRDYAATRERAELRSMLLNQRANLGRGLTLRAEALAETRELWERLQGALN